MALNHLMAVMTDQVAFHGRNAELHTMRQGRLLTEKEARLYNAAIDVMGEFLGADLSGCKNVVPCRSPFREPKTSQ